MQYDKLLWRMAMWIRRPPSKKQLLMWGVILGVKPAAREALEIYHVARKLEFESPPEQGSDGADELVPGK